jgi:hypothetical protein
MDELKHRLTEPPILISLDFSPSALMVILNVDASTTIGWGAVLSQLQPDGEARPARFESGIWSAAELTIVYRPGKLQVVPDALSRMSGRCDGPQRTQTDFREGTTQTQSHPDRTNRAKIPFD